MNCSSCKKEIVGEEYIEVNDYIHEEAWIFCSSKCLVKGFEEGEFDLEGGEEI